MDRLIFARKAIFWNFSVCSLCTASPTLRGANLLENTLIRGLLTLTI